MISATNRDLAAMIADGELLESSRLRAAITDGAVGGADVDDLKAVLEQTEKEET